MFWLESQSLTDRTISDLHGKQIGGSGWAGRGIWSNTMNLSFLGFTSWFTFNGNNNSYVVLERTTIAYEYGMSIHA